MWTRRPSLLAAAATLLLALTFVEGDASSNISQASPDGSADTIDAASASSSWGSNPTPRSSSTTRSAPKPRRAVPDIPIIRADRVDPAPRRLPRPTAVAVASVGIRVPVVALGVADDGTMALPSTPYEAAWYKFGPRPGDPSGTTVLAAHVDTRDDGLGPFARLRDAEKGDRVEIENAAGRRLGYRVTEVRKLDKRRIRMRELFFRTGPPRLVLLTCGGAYDQRTGYSDNVVVTAVPEV